MICLLIGTLFLFHNCCGQAISFPNDPVTIDNKSAAQAELEMPYEEECKENMIRYSMEDFGQICDCRGGLLYYAPKDTCYAPYRKGPCASGQYLVLNKTSEMANCTSNPCLKEGFVSRNGTCFKLKTIGFPCAKDEILTIDDETFDVICEPLIIDVRRIIAAPLKNCPAGSVRNARGLCRNTIMTAGQT